MGLLGHQPQEVVWILGWPQYLITGLRAFDKRSPGGTLWRLTIREGLSAAVEAEVDGVAAHLHRGGWCGRACSYCCSALLLKILKVGRQAKHSHGSDRTGRSPNQNSKLEITRATSKTPINTLNTSPTRARPFLFLLPLKTLDDPLSSPFYVPANLVSDSPHATTT